MLFDTWTLDEFAEGSASFLSAFVLSWAPVTQLEKSVSDARGHIQPFFEPFIQLSIHLMHHLDLLQCQDY